MKSNERVTSSPPVRARLGIVRSPMRCCRVSYTPMHLVTVQRNLVCSDPAPFLWTDQRLKGK